MIRLTTALVCMTVAAAAEPRLSIDITLAPEESYAKAFTLIRAAGADSTSVSFAWDELETAPGLYAPAEDWPALLGLMFPATGFDFTLTFAVIDTVADRRPADLRTLAWDDPVVIARFAAHADSVLARVEHLPLLAVAVGNEIDGLLSTPSEIAAYTRFLGAARAHLTALRPGIPVGAKVTFAALVRGAALWAPVIDAGDGAFVTYYPFGQGFRLRPPGDAARDLDSMIAAATGKPLWLMEAGYPEGGCDAPPGGQSLFFTTLLDAAAARGDAVSLVSLTWLTDMPDDRLAQLVSYYGVADPCFRRYLAGLGLRYGNGQPKPAYETLVRRAEARD